MKRVNVAAIIKDELYKKGLNQSEVAIKIGFSRQAFSQRLRSGSWTIEMIEDLSIVIGVNLFSIIADELELNNDPELFDLKTELDRMNQKIRWIMENHLKQK